MNTNTAPKPVKPTRYISAKCRDCGVRTSALLTERNPARDAIAGPVFFGHWGGICVSCRGCGKQLNATMVRGKFSSVHTCGAKCLASKGPTCECSCGGKNHGAGHEAIPAAPSAGSPVEA